MQYTGLLVMARGREIFNGRRELDRLAATFDPDDYYYDGGGYDRSLDTWDNLIGCVREDEDGSACQCSDCLPRYNAWEVSFYLGGGCLADTQRRFERWGATSFLKGSRALRL